MPLRSYFTAHPPNNSTKNASTTATPSSTTTALNKLFDKYLDSSSSTSTTRDTLQIDSTQRYLSDLSIPLDSPTLLTLSTLLTSTTLGNIPRSGFLALWTHHSCPTIKSQSSLIAKLTANITSLKCSEVFPSSLLATFPGGVDGPAAHETLFRRVYKHTFTLALPADNSNARAIPLDEACEYWRLLLGPSSPGFQWVGADHKTPWLEMWTEYLQGSWGKAVNRDLWGQTLLFAEKSAGDEGLGFWSEEAAWPGVVDEFVGVVKERRGREGWCGDGAGAGGGGDEDGDAKMG